MSPAERALWDRIQRRAAGLSPDLAAAILRAFRTMRLTMSEAELSRQILSGSVDRLLTEVFADPQFQAAADPVRSQLRAGVMHATRSAARDLPRAIVPPTQPLIAFDILNPRVIDAVRTFETRVITTLHEDIRQTVRQHVEAGQVAGQGPRVIARGLREVIGLAPNQERAVANFQKALEGAGRDPLDYKLRDRRFDRALAKGKLNPAQIEKMTEAYRKRMVAFHSETVARSAALDTQRLAQRLSWEDAIEKGIVDRNRLMKKWVATMDDRTRPAHADLNGEVVPFEDAFSSGQQYVGQGDYNCRCVQVMFLAPNRAVA